MTIRWTKITDGWRAERSDGTVGYADWAPEFFCAYGWKRAGWTVAISGPAGRRGWAWSGGGRFPSLAAAKKYLAAALTE